MPLDSKGTYEVVLKLCNSVLHIGPMHINARSRFHRTTFSSVLSFMGWLKVRTWSDEMYGKSAV